MLYAAKSKSKARAAVHERMQALQHRARCRLFHCKKSGIWDGGPVADDTPFLILYGRQRQARVRHVAEHVDKRHIQNGCLRGKRTAEPAASGSHRKALCLKLQVRGWGETDTNGRPRTSRGFRGLAWAAPHRSGKPIIRVTQFAWSAVVCTGAGGDEPCQNPKLDRQYEGIPSRAQQCSGQIYWFTCKLSLVDGHCTFR